MIPETAEGTRRALIVGLGISGIAAAIRLHQAGWDAVVLEKAPGRRAGGYFIALFGTGVATAGHLGLDGPADRAHPDGATYEVTRGGSRRPGSNFRDLPGKPRVMLRGDVEDAAFAALPADVEIRYSTVPTAIAQDADGADVTMLNTASGAAVTERFDLVVGADGLRSTVRRLVFGPHDRYLHRLNYMVAASVLSSTPPGAKEGEGLVLAEPGRSAWVFAFDHASTVLFSYRSDDIDAEFKRPRMESLRAAYGPQPNGELLSWLMDDYEAADEYLFDSAEQVKMDRWYDGRVVLVGDSAWCLTLYSGMGASSGLAGANLLGTTLERHPDGIAAALAEWEAAMRPFIAHHQEQGLNMRSFFTPGNRIERVLRSAFIGLGANRFGRRILDANPMNAEQAYWRTVDVAAA